MDIQDHTLVTFEDGTQALVSDSLMTKISFVSEDNPVVSEEILDITEDQALELRSELPGDELTVESISFRYNKNKDEVVQEQLLEGE